MKEFKKMQLKWYFVGFYISTITCLLLVTWTGLKARQWSFGNEIKMKNYTYQVSYDWRNKMNTENNAYPTSYDWLYGKKLEAALNRTAKNKKRIVFWTPPGADMTRVVEGELPRKCGSCAMSHDMKLIDDKDTRAVVFLVEELGRAPLPPRNPWQYWVWRTAEAIPYMSLGNRIKYSDQWKWNISFNFRRGSDVRMHYGSAVELYGKPVDPDIMKNKKRLAFIAVTNCGLTPGAKVRFRYLQELKKRGFDISLTGRCFDLLDIKRLDEDSMRARTSTYKFHFSFENAYHCRQYITEKFFRPLYSNTIPVVWGARKEDYLEYVPASAFIHMDDFDSMQSLIDYLNYLDKNDTAYLEYFKWRTEAPLPVSYRKEMMFCQLCRLVNGITIDEAYTTDPSNLSYHIDDFISDTAPIRTIPSIYDWYYGEEDKDCLAKNLDVNENWKIVLN